MWRGGSRPNISVAAPFVWRCLSGSTIAPFPHPAHRTGQADFPHPALGQDFTLSRATPSAASEQFSELIGFPISEVLHHVLRLSRTEVPSLHRRYPASAVLRTSPPPQGAQPVPHGRPVGHPLTTPWGLPCCVRFPCAHAVANTPAQRLGVPLRSSRPNRVSLPRNGSRVGLRIVLFEACSA